MYSYEERKKAVERYIQYGYRAAAVIRELGYPDRHTLKRWAREYEEDRDLHQRYRCAGKYSKEQKEAALKHYAEHGRCAAQTTKALGYPSPTVFRRWLNETFPDREKRCVSGKAMVEYPQKEKKQAVIDLCARQGSAQEVAAAHGASRVSLYKWKKQLLGEERYSAMPKRKNPASEDVAALEKRIEDLQAQEAALAEKLYRAQLEYDILEKAAELLKKAQGVNLKAINNREKAEVIDALRDKYRLKELLSVLHMSKSSYCYQENCLHKPDKYKELRTEVQTIFHTADKRYGYRRIHASLKKSGRPVSEKVVRRLMKEEGLAVLYVKRKKYNAYAGEISPEVPNLVNRDFHAETPNTKWLTDITEFSIPAGKVYLSPIIDCFDGLVVSWSIGVSPSADLANTMLDEAISLLRNGELPVVHSDRGSHYRWPGWIDRMEGAGLTRSMSKKGCSPDNSACEGFFGRLKNEFFYGKRWKDVSIEEFIGLLDGYIRWYNECRIKESLGWMSPLEYRRSLGLAA